MNLILKRSCLYLLLWTLGSPVLGQVKTDEEDDFWVEDETPAIASYNLDGCIAYAFRNAEAVKKASLEVSIADAEVGENKSIGLPKINAVYELNHNLRIQRGFISASSFGGPESGGGDSVVTVQFNTKFTGNMGITLEQLLFDFSYLRGLKSARKYVDVQKDRAKLTNIDIAEQVSKSYYAVLVNQERLELLDQNYQRLDTLLRETKALNENGFAERIDVMRTEVSFNNLVTERKKAQLDLEKAKAALKFSMGMPMKDSLYIEGNLENIEYDFLAALAPRFNPENRIENTIFNKQKELRTINLQYNRSIYYPSLSGVFSYGWNTGTNEFGDLWRYRQNWLSYSYYGLKLDIPIMDGFKKRHTLRKIRYQIEQVEVDKAEFEKSAQYQTDNAKLSLSQSLGDLEIQKRNLELADELVKISQIKYENGVGSNLEVTDALTSYKEAETNYYSSLYQALLYKVDLDKALGNLPYN